MMLPNVFSGEWGQLCMFIAVRYYLVMAIAFVKANEKMDSSK